MHFKRFMKSTLVKILAAVFIFLGFGMIHSPMQLVEKLGSIFIGVGALYFIVFLIGSLKKSSSG